MTTHPDALLFNADDIRNIVIRARMLGLRRERVFTALTRPLLTRPIDNPLTGMVVRHIFDEEWPARTHDQAARTAEHEPVSHWDPWHGSPPSWSS